MHATGLQGLRDDTTTKGQGGSAQDFLHQKLRLIHALYKAL
ncbi:hypothetical protein P775_14880 [Puniceibacterium antarcticum]|uniref:Uncharacterized protein n=1 Tax=Puniceibacterium antarcticum TaxID=1206336 RepID=A0A2G8RD53_9RHOB|nr:hypothetical protein P775_14880 [Puniceibacterium antarcticum]